MYYLTDNENLIGDYRSLVYCEKMQQGYNNHLPRALVWSTLILDKHVSRTECAVNK
ncbi:hypothetical protein YC2023_047768 [Brassica napus]